MSSKGMTRGGGVKMGSIDDSWKRVFLTFTEYDTRQCCGRGGLPGKRLRFATTGLLDFKKLHVPEAQKWIEVGI
jgi:hypothetical protein